VLWRKVDLGTLLRIEDAERRRLYADAILELKVTRSGRSGFVTRSTCAQLLDGMRFRRLRCIDAFLDEFLHGTVSSGGPTGIAPLCSRGSKSCAAGRYI
jgi:hypothetical protein